MKRIATAVIIILLGCIVFFQYQKYRKTNPPHVYAYPVRKDIDPNYHNPAVTLHYYETAYRIGAFAREMWYNKGIDVEFTDQKNEESRNATELYTRLRATADQLGEKLAASQKMKSMGFTNEDIQTMEAKGMSATAYRVYKMSGAEGVKKGDQGAGVWEIQQILLRKGYSIPVDGIYKQETEDAIRDFQRKNNLYVSGAMDALTLVSLLK